MKRFDDCGIFTKLLLAFGFIGLLIAGLGAFGLWQLHQLNTGILAMNEARIPALRDLLSEESSLIESRMYHYQLYIALEDPDTANGKLLIADGLKLLDGAKRAALDAEVRFASRGHAAEEQSLFAEAAALTKTYWAASDRLAALVTAGDVEMTRKALAGSIQGTRKKANASLLRVIDYNVQAAAGLAAATQATYERARLLIVVGALTAMLGGLCLGALIAHRIKRPLAQSVCIANRVAAGDLGVIVTVQSNDETGHLQAAMANMVEVLKHFASEQSKLIAAHRAGMVASRMDVEAFSGDYSHMARSTNELAEIHIGVQDQVVQVMTRYAEGDFSVDLEQLPGEHGKVTAAVAHVKENLASISAEIDKLVQAAAAGDFSARGDATRYRFEFRDMVEGLNRLMDTSARAFGDLGHLLGAIACGNLNETIKAEYEGSLGQIRDDANATVHQLKRVIGEIFHATESIHTAAREIADGNLDLSSRTEEQAASLEQTAASMEEQTATVRQNASNAQRADELASHAAKVASRASTEVGAMVATMQNIGASSGKIESITSLIDGIAFQTNILSLNAAVEAARAGLEGRGFAVVATEIRALAQRSGEAAKQIKTLVDQEAIHVKAGHATASSAEATMRDVAQAVREVSKLLAELTVASAEQAEGIEQVNSAIAQMDQVTQQNAALVEEAAAAAAALSDQAESLRASVAVFETQAPIEKSLSDGPLRTTLPGPSRVAAIPRIARLK
ncbi:MAG: methyl-accepting chemotaxis protein [Burkholderiaceae bacterium]